MTSPGRLLVIAPNWLGDAVMALPALGDLRRALSAARVIVAARRSVAGLFRMSPLVDEVLVLEGRGRMWPGGAGGRDLAAVRAARADTAVLLPNSFASAWLTWRAGVGERWGYATDMRGLLLTRPVPRPRIRRHQSNYYRHLLRALGVERAEGDPVLVVPAEAIGQARSLLVARGWDQDRPLVALAPGAAYGGAKRWPEESFARTVTELVRLRGVHCALVGSTADAGTTRWVRSLVPEDARDRVSDLAGATTLEMLAGVMRLASACVSNDSGAMHLAGAAGVGLVALFGPTRERETMPLPLSGQRVEVLINHVWCRPCMLRECPLDHRCMTGLAPERVLARVVDVIASTRPAAGAEASAEDARGVGPADEAPR
jgi:heptosyltransferase-2